MPQVKVGEADDVGCGCSEATTGRPRHWSREGSSSLAVGGHSAVLPSCCPPVLLVPRLLLCYRAPSSCTTPSWARSYGSTSRWRRKRTTNPFCPVVVSCRVYLARARCACSLVLYNELCHSHVPWLRTLTAITHAIGRGSSLHSAMRRRCGTAHTAIFEHTTSTLLRVTRSCSP